MLSTALDITVSIITTSLTLPTVLSTSPAEAILPNLSLYVWVGLGES